MWDVALRNKKGYVLVIEIRYGRLTRFVDKLLSGIMA
jgi:hypothetical protein